MNPKLYNSKEVHAKYIVIKHLKSKTKEKILKALIEKWLPIEEKEIRMAANILSETMEARKKWHSIFQVLVSIVNTESYIHSLWE